MSGKLKELIAVGASVAANCQPCLDFHAGKAREFGADERDIAMAVAVGKAVRKGAAAKMDAFAESVIAQPAGSSGGTDSDCGIFSG